MTRERKGDMSSRDSTGRHAVRTRDHYNAEVSLLMAVPEQAPAAPSYPLKSKSAEWLAEQAEMITLEGRAGDAATTAAYEHYRRAGARLVQVKVEVGHGHFGRWLDANFPWTQRTAERWMAEATKSTRMSDLTTAAAGEGVRRATRR
ncbi:MAG TPA: hypothetical protein VKS25_16545, partial [Solirubrobacteraceae bacterium]|nr:hypothetical protein [Solirubrobacteraceae bacterium]